MTILELLADLDLVRVVGTGPDSRSLLAGPTDLEVRIHDAGGDLDVGDDEAVVTTVDGDLGATLGSLTTAAPGATTVVLVLASELGALDVDDVLARLSEHDLEVRRAVTTTFTTRPAAVVATHASDGSELRSRARLQEGVIAALRAQVAEAHGAVDAIAEVRAEADRRAARIQALTAEVDDLRDRLRAAGSSHSRELAARDKKVTALERRVRDLERSVSYRLGHAFVRLVKDPTLLRKAPSRLLAMLRRRFRR